MYLKRVTLSGFKSFGGKAELDLEPGITAVVGPNGSGKSNLADAVRWALGEQSKGRLRLSDREEVVFAGTEKRARASLAEVTLLFNNEDGAFPLELTEVEISRRLYRSGETDYRLGGRPVRLSDIQQLLAEAGFGTGSYAVIGQGMIDTFLMSSPSERKLLFDEAAGIRSAELKREAALRKLNATEANLTRLRDIEAELAPRLDLLRAAVAAAEQQRTLATRVEELRARVLAAAASELAAREAALAAERDQLTAELRAHADDHRALEREQAAHQRAAAAVEQHRTAQRAAVAQLEADYERHVAAVAELRGQLAALESVTERRAALTQRQTELTAELAANQTRVHDCTEELAANRATSTRADKALGRAAADVASAQAKLLQIRQSTADGSQQQYISHALALLQTVAQELTQTTPPIEQVRLMVYKAGRLLSHAHKTGDAEILTAIREAQARLESAMTRRETVSEHQTNIIINRRSLEIDLAHLRTAGTRLEAELAAVGAELAATSADDSAGMRKSLAAAERQLAAVQQKLAAERQTLEAGVAQPAVTEAAELATRLERLRAATAATQERLDGTRAALAGLSEAHAALRGRAKAWGLPAPAAPEHPKAAAAELATLEQELMQAETELATRESLHSDAAAEHTAVSARAAELSHQIADLIQAESDLRELVARLDAVIQTRFEANFAKLTERFSHYFTQLFGGGSATLELEREEDNQYGIVIKANPKGKRVTNLSALSGGERAMAGVALLAAILSVNPSPFVVLDEIDAALDEANSGRLSSILTELASHSQLIVITHNRQTMQAADVLFGVTMSEHHVSHLISLRLEQATELAAR